MKLYEGRSTYLKFSRTNNSSNLSKFVGFLFVAWGAILFYATYTGHFLVTDESLHNYVLLFCIALVIIGISIWQIGAKGDCAPKHTLVYDPGKMAKKRLWELILGFIFMVCFSAIFIAIGFIHFMFFIPGTIFFILTFFGAYYGLKSITKLFKKNKKFGKSELKILSGNINRGFSVTVRLINPEVNLQLDKVDYILRNIAEKWEPKNPERRKGKNNPSRLRTYVLEESSGIVKIDKEQIEFEIEIPAEQSKSTDYHLNHPIYWELEVYNSSEKFLSRFYLDVS